MERMVSRARVACACAEQARQEERARARQEQLADERKTQKAAMKASREEALAKVSKEYDVRSQE